MKIGLRVDTPYNIITVDTFFNKRNKTLAAAKKFESFLNNHYKNIDAINVVSINGHSRRSYLAYKIATLHKRQVGIISLNDISLTPAQTSQWAYHVLGEYSKFFVTAIEYLIL